MNAYNQQNGCEAIRPSVGDVRVCRRPGYNPAMAAGKWGSNCSQAVPSQNSPLSFNLQPYMVKTGSQLIFLLCSPDYDILIITMSGQGEGITEHKEDDLLPVPRSTIQPCTRDQPLPVQT